MEHDNLSDAIAYIQALHAANKRLRTDIGHIRGFASVMDENNWRDCKSAG